MWKKSAIYSPVWFAVVVLLASVCQLCVFLKSVAMLTHSWYTVITVSLADMLLLYIPYWFVSPRFRKYILLPFWGFTVWYIINLLYLRAYHDLLPVSSLMLFGNVDSVTIRSSLALLSAIDIFIIVPPLVTTLLYFIYFRNKLTSFRFSTPVRVAAIALTLFVFVGQQLFFCRQFHVAYGEPYLSYYKPRPDVSRQSTLREYGLLRYIFIESLKAFHSKRDLRADELALVRSYICGKIMPPVSIPDSVDNSEKNLILIIVESLNSAVVGYCVDGRPITPVLNEICRSCNSVVALDMVSQVGCGRSSDGQLMYNTGLLPMRDEVTALRYADNEYPSLADALNKSVSVEVIGENAGMWNHRATNLAFGYDALVDGCAGDVRDSYDGEIFQRALSLMKELPQPFFAQITTLGMHDPYDGPDGYLHAVSRFDESLGEFLTALKSAGLYDNSVIAIVSDHNGDISLPGSVRRDDAIMLAILNSGIDAKIECEVAQIDVYPTILDVMGVSGIYHWPGMGRSLLRDYGSEERDMSHLWNISENIIASDYFRRYAEGEMIAHGGGSIDGKVVTNSLEAVQKSIADGFRYIELDLCLTSDSMVAATHDWHTFHEMTDSVEFDYVPTLREFSESKLYGKYTPLTSILIDSLWKANPSLVLVTDKLDDASVLSAAFPDLRRRIIVECFTEKAADELAAAGFKTMYNYHRLRNGIKLKAKSILGFGVDPYLVTCPVVRYEAAEYKREEKWLGKRSAVFSVADTAGAARFISENPIVRFVYTDNL